MSRKTSQAAQQAGEATETVAIIIPTLNEERSIGKVIDGVPVGDLLQNGLKTAVYVVDGRSVDHTRDIAVQAKLSSLRDGLGIGAFLCRKRLVARTTNREANRSQKELERRSANKWPSCNKVGA